MNENGVGALDLDPIGSMELELAAALRGVGHRDLGPLWSGLRLTRGFRTSAGDFLLSTTGFG
jgi:hypothetical protein